ncbi:MAG: hypothetical protein K6E37_08970 [Bacteroidales bacterium]|nr:hypothetical protein [Bacteroidales bacterium]
MKKHLFILLASLLALASCNKEIQTEVVEPQDGPEAQTNLVPMTFKASLEDLGTKSDIADDFILWESSDKIAIFDGTALNEFSVSALSPSGKGAEFSGSAAPASSYLAVAPYSAATNIRTEEQRFSITIHGSQTIIGSHSVDPESLLSTAVATGTTDLAFENQFALLKVKLENNNIMAVTVKGNNNEVISGTNHFYFGGEGAPRIDLTNAGGKQVTLMYKATASSANSAFPAGEYYIAIWPTEFSGGYSVILTDEDGAKSIKTNSNSQSLVRNGGQDLSTVDNSSFCPPVIMTAAQLKMWRRLATHGAYAEGDEVKLGADIDLNGYAWTPVEQFLGIFDGQNHKIYNFTVSNPGDNRVGFIRTLGSSGGEAAVLKNVVFGSSDGTTSDGVSSISLSIDSSSSWSYAGLVGYAQKNSHILNVTTFMPVTADAALTTKHAIGGIAGSAGDNAIIESCINKAAVTSNSACTSTDDSAVGGILGQTGNTDVKILSCTNNGTIENKCVGVSCIGGVVAKSTGTGLLVDECVNSGQIKNNAACVGSTKGNWDISVGGVIGFMGNTTTVNKCSNSGRLYNGVATNGDYDYCFGGVVGASTKSGCIIKGCSNTAEFMYADNTAFNSYFAAGGILGYTRGTVTITKADDGTRTTNSGQFFQRRNHAHHFYIGGIAGLIEKQASSVIEFCTNEGRIVGSDPQTTDKINFYAGGIAGSASTGIVRDCINNGFLIARDGNLIAWFGGIVGAKDKYPTSVLRCVNNGAVSGYNSSGSSSIGGILGVFQPDKTEVRDCINSGLITTANVYTNASGNTAGEPVSYQNKDYYKGGLFGYVNVPAADVTDNVTGCIINCTLSNQTVGKDNYTGIIAGQTKSTTSTSYKLVFGTASDPVLIVNTSKFEYGTASNPATITSGDVMNTDANVKKWLMGSTSKLYDATNGTSNTNIVDFNYVIVTSAQAGIE